MRNLSVFWLNDFCSKPGWKSSQALQNGGSMIWDFEPSIWFAAMFTMLCIWLSVQTQNKLICATGCAAVEGDFHLKRVIQRDSDWTFLCAGNCFFWTLENRYWKGNPQSYRQWHDYPNNTESTHIYLYDRALWLILITHLTQCSCSKM